jgi:hypothetical protein
VLRRSSLVECVSVLHGTCLQCVECFFWPSVCAAMLGDTISCNGTERNETKQNDFVSCFSNYYRDITMLRNETIPFRFEIFAFRFVF